MKQIKINPNNEMYYSDDFIKGFNVGAQRQFEADMSDRNNCETCRFDDRYGEESICSNCSRHYRDCYAPKDEQSGKEQANELVE